MLDLPDASVALWTSFLPEGDADRLLAHLREEIAWDRHTVRMFGREIPCPRLSAWVGDPGTTYRYSGVDHEPRPWTPDLERLRSGLETVLGERFNSVLLNLYRDGGDSMGWHADDEPELGPEPTIASVSLGAERTFRLKHRTRTEATATVRLPHGSLLVMSGPTQRYWRHALPRSRAVRDARINLTFRRILAPDE